jgi:hypothetical protein
MKEACPLLFGDAGIKIEATDDTYRRLLKSSLRQGATAAYLMHVRIENGSYQPTELTGLFLRLDHMRETTEELWGSDRKELIPRLKEFVVLAKIYERFTKARVDAGTDPAQNLYEAHRHRLATEAVLWKAMHPPTNKK